MALEKIYGDNKIYYNESSDEWRCDELSLRASTLSELKKKIDKHGEQETKFTRVEAYIQEYEKFEHGFVTSEPDKFDLWVTFDSKRRRMVRWSHVYPVNAHNTERIQAVEELTKQIKALEEKRSNLIEEMKNYAELKNAA